MPNETAPVMKRTSKSPNQSKMTAREYKQHLVSQISNKEMKQEKLIFKKPKLSKSDLYSSIN
ncbi:MAG: hypothetical protein ACQEUT_16160 [Bacillota bacterium]